MPGYRRFGLQAIGPPGLRYEIRRGIARGIERRIQRGGARTSARTPPYSYCASLVGIPRRPGQAGRVSGGMVIDVTEITSGRVR